MSPLKRATSESSASSWILWNILCNGLNCMFCLPRVLSCTSQSTRPLVDSWVDDADRFPDTLSGRGKGETQSAKPDMLTQSKGTTSQWNGECLMTEPPSGFASLDRSMLAAVPVVSSALDHPFGFLDMTHLLSRAVVLENVAGLN